MDADVLLKTIDLEGDFRDRLHAERAAQAVLSVLGERLQGREPADLAAQLPQPLAEALPVEGGGESFGVEEFDRRVAEREGGRCSLPEAHRHAAAVLQAVLSSVSRGERRDVAAQLSADYWDLLPADALSGGELR